MRRDDRNDNEARLDDLGTDPGQVGPDSAGQSGDPQQLSPDAEASEESVEELADTDQALFQKLGVTLQAAHAGD